MFTLILSKAGLAVLETLAVRTEATPTELATQTGYSQDHIYDVLDAMLKTGLIIETRGPSNQRRVNVTAHPMVEAYRELRSSFSYVDWDDLLSPVTLRVGWFLDEPRTASEIADHLNITRQGVYRALSPLKGRAMLDPSGPEYALSDDLAPLIEFARAVVRSDHRDRSRDLAPSATIKWCDPLRALIRVYTETDAAALRDAADWRLTGLARFRDYGLEFFLAGEPAFWYGPEGELTPADLVCHTLLLGADSRRVSYAMLLIESTNTDEGLLLRTATRYGLEPEIASMHQAIEGTLVDEGVSTVSIPSQTEYGALRAQYRVP